jgi:type II secretory pathway pseudopilin PulG
MKKNKAFTLTEILLVSVLFSLIGITVFNAFSNGIKLWARGERLVVESNIGLFLDQLGQDARDVPLITGIPLRGTGNRISFPTIVMTPADHSAARAQEEYIDQIGAVQYNYDPADKKIYRRQANYSQALKGIWSNPVEVASGIENVIFQYHFSSDKGMQTKTETDEVLPMGISVGIEFEVDGQPRHMRRFFPIPVGGGL